MPARKVAANAASVARSTLELTSKRSKFVRVSSTPVRWATCPCRPYLSIKSNPVRKFPASLPMASFAAASAMGIPAFLTGFVHRIHIPLGLIEKFQGGDENNQGVSKTHRCENRRTMNSQHFINVSAMSRLSMVPTSTSG